MISLLQLPQQTQNLNKKHNPQTKALKTMLMPKRISTPTLTRSLLPVVGACVYKLADADEAVVVIARSTQEAIVVNLPGLYVLGAGEA